MSTGRQGVAESERGRRDVEETAWEATADRAGQTETGSGASSTGLMMLMIMSSNSGSSL